MKVLISGGAKSGNIVSALENRLRSSGVDFIEIPFIEDIPELFIRGDYFDRAVIIEPSWTHDNTDTRESRARKLINEFAGNMADRGMVGVSYIFITSARSTACLIDEETMLIRNYSAIVIKEPKYYVNFFSMLATTELGDIPEQYLYKEDNESTVEEPQFPDLDAIVADIPSGKAQIPDRIVKSVNQTVNADLLPIDTGFDPYAAGSGLVDPSVTDQSPDGLYGSTQCKGNSGGLDDPFSNNPDTTENWNAVCNEPDEVWERPIQSNPIPIEYTPTNESTGDLDSNIEDAFNNVPQGESGLPAEDFVDPDFKDVDFDGIPDDGFADSDFKDVDFDGIPDDGFADPDFDKLTPDEDFVDPDFDKLTPDEDFVDPDFDNLTPDEDFVDPDFDNLTPDEDFVDPDFDKLTPDEDFVDPDFDNLTPDEPSNSEIGEPSTPSDLPSTDISDTGIPADDFADPEFSTDTQGDFNNYSDTSQSLPDTTEYSDVTPEAYVDPNQIVENTQDDGQPRESGEIPEYSDGGSWVDPNNQFNPEDQTRESGEIPDYSGHGASDMQPLPEDASVNVPDQAYQPLPDNYAPQVIGYDTPNNVEHPIDIVAPIIPLVTPGPIVPDLSIPGVNPAPVGDYVPLANAYTPQEDFYGVPNDVYDPPVDPEPEQYQSQNPVYTDPNSAVNPGYTDQGQYPESAPDPGFSDDDYDTPDDRFSPDDYGEDEPTAEEETEEPEKPVINRPVMNDKQMKASFDAFASRGNSIVVTGCGGCGTSTIAMNLANTICNLGYTVLLVDMDTMNKTQAYMTRDAYECIDCQGASVMAAINSTSGINAYVSIVRQGFHLLSMGMASDSISIEKAFKKEKLSRFINLAKTSHNFVIYDIPFGAAVDTLEAVTFAADNIVLTVDASNWGVSKMLLSMCNIGSEDMQEALFSRGQILFNKYRGLNKVLGKKVKKTSDIAETMDSKVVELIGEDPGYRFSEMHICGTIKDDPEFENGWFGTVQYSDTKNGFELFTRILKNIVLHL